MRRNERTHRDGTKRGLFSHKQKGQGTSKGAARGVGGEGVRGHIEHHSMLGITLTQSLTCVVLYVWCPLWVAGPLPSQPAVRPSCLRRTLVALTVHAVPMCCRDLLRSTKVLRPRVTNRRS